MPTLCQLEDFCKMGFQVEWGDGPDKENSLHPVYRKIAKQITLII